MSKNWLFLCIFSCISNILALENEIAEPTVSFTLRNTTGSPLQAYVEAEDTEGVTYGTDEQSIAHDTEATFTLAQAPAGGHYYVQAWYSGPINPFGIDKEIHPGQTTQLLPEDRRYSANETDE